MLHNPFRTISTTLVSPRSHAVDNFGPLVQAVTFSVGGKVYTLNRAGKRNVMGFTGRDRRTGVPTYTLSNGTETFKRLNGLDTLFISLTFTDGHTEQCYTY